MSDIQKTKIATETDSAATVETLGIDVLSQPWQRAEVHC